MSKQKQALLDVIPMNEGHKTAEGIFMLGRAQKVDVSIATVYRDLGILTEEGSIRRIAVPGEPDRIRR